MLLPNQGTEGITDSTSTQNQPIWPVNLTSQPWVSHPCRLLNTICSWEETMHFRLRTLTLASTALAALGLASSAAPSATTTTTTTESVKAKTAKKPRHCVNSSAGPDTRAVCYDDFTAAIAAAIGGQITDAPADVRVAMKDQRLLARLNHTGEKKDTAAFAPTASTGLMVIGILYSDTDFVGSTYTVSRSTGCTGPLNNIDHDVAYVGDDWNDEGESIQVFQNCYARLWQHRDFQGAMLDFAGDRSDFGAVMANEVSSMQFS
jgi:hypothetical protein